MHEIKDLRGTSIKSRGNLPGTFQQNAHDGNVLMVLATYTAILQA